MVSERVKDALLKAWETLTIAHDDGSITVLLDKPVKLEGAEVDRLKLRKLTAGDFKRLNTKRIKAGDGDAVADAICVLAALPPSTYDQLSGADCHLMGEVIAGFLLPSRVIGEAFSRISAAS